MLDTNSAVFLDAKMSGTPTKFIGNFSSDKGDVVQDTRQPDTKTDNMSVKLKNEEKYRLLIKI